MVTYAIMELDDGLAVAVVQPGQSAEEAVAREHGVLVDPGPYPTYDDAYDALCELNDEEDEE